MYVCTYVRTYNRTYGRTDGRTDVQRLHKMSVLRDPSAIVQNGHSGGTFGPRVEVKKKCYLFEEFTWARAESTLCHRRAQTQLQTNEGTTCCRLEKNEIIEGTLGRARNEDMYPPCPRSEAFSVKVCKLDRMPGSERTIGQSLFCNIRKCENQRFTAE